MHDTTSKMLYSLPETIEALARAMAPDRADDMDFTRLARLSSEYPATDQRSRYGDMLWEFHLRDGAAVLIVVEFQSDVDHDMPLRLLQYTGGAWLEWARVRKPRAGDGIPLVMPVLIYGGRGRWTPPTRLERCLPAASASWLAGQPRFEYLLLEERRGGTEDLPEDNLVRELVSVCRARGGGEMVRAVSRLRERMDGREEGDALDRAVAEWLKAVVADLDAALGHELRAATTTKEVMEVIKPKGKWAVRWYEDGRDEERAEWIERQSRLLRRQVTRRFGDAAARELAEDSPPLRDPEVAEAAFEAVVDCDTAEEFFARVRGCAVPPASSPEA